MRDKGENVKVKKSMKKLLQILSHYMTGPLQEERKLQPAKGGVCKWPLNANLNRCPGPEAHKFPETSGYSPWNFAIWLAKHLCI